MIEGIQKKKMIDNEETSVIEFRDLLKETIEQIDGYLASINKPQKVWVNAYMLQINKINKDITGWN